MKFLREEIPKVMIGWVVTAMLGLCVLCVVTIYQSYEQMVFSSREALVQRDKYSEMLQKLGEFIEKSLHISERSGVRTLQFKKITEYTEKGIIDGQGKWLLLSATARIEAIADLAVLDRYSEDTFPLTTPLKDGLKSLLNSEINLWEKSDQYINAKYLMPKEEIVEDEAFRNYTKAFLGNIQSAGSIVSLHMQTTDRILNSQKDYKSKNEKDVSEFDYIHKKIKLAFVGFLITLMLISILIFFLIYPSLKARLVDS